MKTRHIIVIGATLFSLIIIVYWFEIDEGWNFLANTFLLFAFLGAFYVGIKQNEINKRQLDLNKGKVIFREGKPEDEENIIKFTPKIINKGNSSINNFQYAIYGHEYDDKSEPFKVWNPHEIIGDIQAGESYTLPFWFKNSEKENEGRVVLIVSFLYTETLTREEESGVLFYIFNYKDKTIKRLLHGEYKGAHTILEEYFKKGGEGLERGHKENIYNWLKNHPWKKD